MQIRDVDLPTHPRVYPVREDSILLARSARVRPWERVLEVGCGLGLASFSAAREGARVVAADLNPFALQAVREQSRQRHVAIDVVRTDLFQGLGRFDVVLSNPPYLPTSSEDKDPDPWHERAVDGGPDGLSFVRRFLEQLPDHLSPGGRAYLLVASTPQAPVRSRGLPVPAPRLRVNDLAGDAVLPAETLWVLELVANGPAAT